MGTTQLISPSEVAKLVSPVVTQAQGMSVVSAEDYEMACTFLQLVATRKKQIDDVFDPIVKKAHETHKEAVAQKQKVMGPLIQAEQMVKFKVTQFRSEQEQLRREDEARLAAEARKKQEDDAIAEAAALEAAGDKHLADIVLQTAAEAPAPVVALESTVPKQEGIAGRKNWKYRITNEALIPREYLSPDPVKLGAVVRSQKNLAKIPGIEIYCEDTVSVRAL